MKTLAELMKDMSTAHPASHAAVETAQRAVGHGLPPEYLQLLAPSNGAEGPVGPASYLVIWPIEEVAPLNTAHEVATWIPGVVLFEGDGGNTLYGFDLRTEHVAVVEVDPYEMEYDSLVVRGHTLVDFLEYLDAEQY